MTQKNMEEGSKKTSKGVESLQIKSAKKLVKDRGALLSARSIFDRLLCSSSYVTSCAATVS